MTDEQALTPGQQARAAAALDAWYAGEYRAPGVAWDAEELERMHAALEAPDVGAALDAFGTAPGSWLSTPVLGDPRRGGEADESPYDAAVRELKEELGLTCAPGRLLAVDWVPPRRARGNPRPSPKSAPSQPASCQHRPPRP